MRPVRVALYLRMSTDKQETSIPDQRRALADHAKKQRYKIVGEYADEGISGDATEKRIAFQRMVADSGKKLFDLILCWDQDRFGRFDPLEGGYWIKPIRDAGVQLETLAQGRIDWSDFASRLVWTVTQEAKHAYLRTMSRDVVRGLKSAVESGVYPGSAPFGYRKQNKRLVLGPSDEVETVRRIFELRLEHKMGGRTIAARLRLEGHAAPGAGKWTQNQVRYILARRTYCGVTQYGKVKRGKYHSLDSPLVLTATHEPIVTAEEFEAAQRINRASTVGYRGGRPSGALTGLLTCGLCGSVMYKFGCGYLCGRYHRGEGCGCCRVAETDILQRVAEKIRENVGENVGDLAKRIERRHKHRNNSKRTEQLNRRLAELDSQIHRAAERLLTIDDDLLSTVKKKLREMRAAREQIAAELQQLTPQTLDPLAVARQLVDLPSLMLRLPPEGVRRVVGEAVDSIVLRFSQKAQGHVRRFFRLDSVEISLRQ